MKLSFVVGIVMLVLAFGGCRSVAVRWMNGGEPIDNPCKWECDREDSDDWCIPYLTRWHH